jgi:serine protease Do
MMYDSASSTTHNARSQQMRSFARKVALPAVLVVGLGSAATAVEVVRTSLGPADAQTAVEPHAPDARAAAPQSLATAFRGASRTAMPAVVYVQVESAPRAVSNQIPPQLRGTPFEDFFRGMPQQQQQRPQVGSGSGFIISPDGYVLTNNHVVEGTSRVTVILTDKREFEAKVVGRDPNTDVAVLKIEAKNLPTVQFGDADELQIGDWVLALGYPLSLGETATAGIVSAKGRQINILGRNEDAKAPLEHFIQTDAAINPGNSGGPLVDLDGRVIGINTAIASPTGFYSGYGFAVPINLARRVADDLIRYGAVHRPKLGIAIADVQPADVEVFKLSDARGSVVQQLPDGPAKDAGVQLGDVIVAVNGQPITDTGDLMERVARMQPGQDVTLDLVRYGKRERVKVKLGAFEAERTAANRAEEKPADAVARLGFQAVQMTPEMARRAGLSYSDGVVITAVDPMGPAPQSLRGVRIEQFNGRAVKTVEDLRSAAAAVKAGSAVSIIGTAPDGNRVIQNFRTRS